MLKGKGAKFPQMSKSEMSKNLESLSLWGDMPCTWEKASQVLTDSTIWGSYSFIEGWG